MQYLIKKRLNYGVCILRSARTVIIFERCRLLQQFHHQLKLIYFTYSHPNPSPTRRALSRGLRDPVAVDVLETDSSWPTNHYRHLYRTCCERKLYPPPTDDNSRPEAKHFHSPQDRRDMNH
ncbi:unnamed protein product [Macrosiphum euphorbiae]|uniref:Uncharacterized protein n=1 Tax=Macrosiphum euphorbiae TaxID=13131 RepID=A0AAV0XGN2_9HEMI|nr:unnamed protein product [Macrosiphum euphorbiae]